MPVTSFDAIAQDYDTSFSESKIGRAQRAQVYAFLEEAIGKAEGLNILELNCGTGIDAIYLAQKGQHVLATDISEGMTELVRKKSLDMGLSNNIQAKTLDINNINELNPSKKYDLIFSNFGGLNCLSPIEIEKLGKNLLPLLSDDGHFIAVVMPRFCLWETLYFLTKMSFKKAFRRLSKGPVLAALDEQTEIKTWYYAPPQFRKLLGQNFKMINKRPVGFFIPPSYLTYISQKTPRFFKLLVAMEKKIRGLSYLANVSDHFYITLKKSGEP